MEQEIARLALGMPVVVATAEAVAPAASPGGVPARTAALFRKYDADGSGDRHSTDSTEPCGRATRASVATACAGVALSCRFRAGVAFSCRLSGGLSFAEIEKALCEDFPSMPAYAREHLPVAFKQYAEGETLSLPGFMKMHAGAACRRDATLPRHRHT